jgi:hypothetical protein
MMMELDHDLRSEIDDEDGYYITYIVGDVVFHRSVLTFMDGLKGLNYHLPYCYYLNDPYYLT